MSSASSRFWVICCATRKIWRSYCRTNCSNAAVSPFLARATSATSGWISSVAGDWMAGMVKRCEKRTLKSHGLCAEANQCLLQCKCHRGGEQSMWADLVRRNELGETWTAGECGQARIEGLDSSATAGPSTAWLTRCCEPLRSG